MMGVSEKWKRDWIYEHKVLWGDWPGNDCWVRREKELPGCPVHFAKLSNPPDSKEYKNLMKLFEKRP